jgi:valyl-tRNA synthetase
LQGRSIAAPLLSLKTEAEGLTHCSQFLRIDALARVPLSSKITLRANVLAVCACSQGFRGRMPREIAKAYEPTQIEPRWAEFWVKEALFKAPDSPSDRTFSIALPPPNVTGSIHIGHMLEHTQIDTLVRWHRMRGCRTLWLPGMDHAGIATQFVVERMLAKEGVTRQQLGREEFERRVWKWKEESGGVIKEQMIRLGASCDWTRERFTLEPALYRAVLHAFLQLYHEGLIYRGRYMVNWCPRCQTAISDLEVVHHERTGEIWNIRYPIMDGAKPSATEYLIVATTRPETMLGDTAVAVHPDDERYQRLIGRKVLLPLMNREIPVIADSYVDREFGTGVVKITPAHDPNDFEIGKRHNLPEIDVMTDTGIMNEAAGKYAGLERFAARGRIVKELTELGLVESIKEHLHAVGTCDRCKSLVEPRISTQWFMKMKPLAEPAKQVVLESGIEVVPQNQRTILLKWLDNIRDWCISRQLWWGHRIPIWHCADCKEMVPALGSRVEIVEGHARAAEVPKTCPKCGGSKLTQDTDVLDTWFSSGLWPFSTLGWPDDTKDLRDFYPTSLLISGYDILFFWDARMIMMGMHLTANRFGGDMQKAIPFRELYLHSLVRTAEGQKMSKTKGTGVDPLQLTQDYGTDALRYMLVSMAAPGTDIAMSLDRLGGAKAFANKIWNAARFLFVNLDKFEQAGSSLEELAAPEIREQAPYAYKGTVPLVDRWLFARLAGTVNTVNDALETFRFHEAAQEVYQFFWGDFCDWYIEWVKPDLQNADRERAVVAWKNLFAGFDAALRLLHPIMPFLTEELWHQLPQKAGAKSIALDEYPQATWSDVDALYEFGLLQEIIQTLRTIRAEMKLDPKKKVAAEFYSQDAATRATVEVNKDGILRLAILSDLQVQAGKVPEGGGGVRSTAHFDLRVPYTADTIDVAAERTRLQKEIAGLEKAIASKEAQLNNETFRSKAPDKIIQQMEAALTAQRIELEKLKERLRQLGEN